MCGFLEIRLEKTRKKKSKKVGHRTIDRSVVPSIFFPFFPFFSLSCLVLLEYSYFDPRNYFISRHTFDREKREREERREKGEEREDGSVSLLVATMAQTRGTKDCFVLSLFILKKRNVYPLFSRCFIISHQIVLSFIHKIIIKQVYPIFAALGSAVGLCTFFCTRQLTTSPGFTASKAKRATAIPETSQDVKEGEKFRNHFIRRTLSGRRPEIMPGLNSSMTKMN